MFRPQIQKTQVLVIMALISTCLLYFVSNSKTYINNFNVDKKHLAVDIMKKSIDIINYDNEISSYDVYRTGLIGEKNSDITTILSTDDSFLESKIATTSPNFSAFVIDLFEESNLQQGDTIAITMTGSFPGANIAVLSACKAMEIYPIIISSVGASSWGANNINQSWIDIENKLNENNIFNYMSIASSIGGENDLGENLTDKGIEIIEDIIGKYDINFINEVNLQENVLKKIDLFGDLNKFAAFVNIGGNASSLGQGKGKNYIRGGVINPLLKDDVSEIFYFNENNDSYLKEFKKSISYNFLNNDIPLINIKNINLLLKDYGMEYLLNPDLNEIKKGKLYYDIEKFNLVTIWFALIISILMSLSVGVYSHYEIRKKMKEDEIESII